MSPLSQYTSSRELSSYTNDEIQQDFHQDITGEREGEGEGEGNGERNGGWIELGLKY